MSIASPTSTIPPSSIPNSGVVALDAADPSIQSRIEETRGKIRFATLSIGGLWFAILLIGVTTIWVLADHTFSIGSASRWATWFALIATMVTIAITWLIPTLKSGVAIEFASRCIERRYPQLRQSLTTYVTLCNRAKSETLGGRVVRTEGRRLAKFLAKNDSPVVESLVPMQLWLAAIGLIFAFGIYSAVSSKSVFPSVARLAMPWASIDAPKRVLIRSVAPGSATVLAGRNIEFNVDADNLREDDIVRVEINHPQLQSFELRQLDNEGRNTTFAGNVEIPSSASGVATYQVIAGDAVSKIYELGIENLPSVSIERIEYRHPEYTGDLEPIIRQGGNVSAMEGTRVTIHARANRPIKSANLEFNPVDDGGRIRITAGSIPMTIADDGLSIQGSFRLRPAGSEGIVRRTAYRVRIADSDGVLNPKPIIYDIDTLPDLQPEITISMPSGGYREVPITAQQIIELHATDPDFGLSGVAIELTRATNPKRAIIWQAEPGSKAEKTRIFEYRFRPKALGLGVGQELTFRAIARDNRFDTNQAVTWDTSVAGVSASRDLRLKIVDTSKKPSEATEPGDIDPADDGLGEVDEEPAVQSKQEPSEQGGQEGDSGGQGQDGSQDQDSSEGDQGNEGGRGAQGQKSSESQENSEGEEKSDGQQGGSDESESPSDNGMSEDGQESNSTGESQPSSENGDNGAAEPSSNQSNPGSSSDPSDSSNPNDMNQGQNGQQAGSTSEPSNSDQTGQPPEDGGSGASDGSETSQGTPGDADGGPSQSDAVEPSGRQGSGEDSASGSTSMPNSNGEESSSGNQNTANNQESSGGSNSQTEQPNESSPGDDSSGSPSSPASNDGEAFERIADYLKNQPNSEPGEGSSPKPNEDPSGNGEPSAGDPSDQREINQDSQRKDSTSPGEGQELAKDDMAGDEADPANATNSGESTPDDSSERDGSKTPSDESSSSNPSNQDPKEGEQGVQQTPRDGNSSDQG